MRHVDLRSSAAYKRVLSVVPARGPLLLAGLLAVALGFVLLSPDQQADIAAPASTSGQAPRGSVLVHVAGAVRKPGLYELTEGSRIADAIDLAGGPTRHADLHALNLAQLVVDGSRVEVPRAAAAAASEIGPSSSAPGSSPSATLVGLNSASQAELETIPGIGPVKAAAILSFREENGVFTSVDDLLGVAGIGPATLEALRPYVTL